MPSTWMPGILNDRPRCEKSVSADERVTDVALVGGAVAEEGQRHALVVAVAVGEGEPGAQRNLSADDAVAAVEVFLLGEHVHGAALPPGIAAPASGQFRHHPPRGHVHRQHVAVVAIGGDHLVAVLHRHLQAGDHGFLADVEMAETADEPHSIKLAGLFLEAADQQHVAVGLELLLLGKLDRLRRDDSGRRFDLGLRFG
jgi:hypothetical protein